jgi:tetratricopeptide (TPR) repeat protein
LKNLIIRDILIGMKSKNFLLLSILLTVGGCIEVAPSQGQRETTPTVVSSPFDDNLAINKTNDLKQEYLSQQDLERRQRRLIEAEADYNQDPNNLEYIIWYGRRLAYLGKYQEAINIFTEGLKKYPQSYKLYRHRGHRYITIRQFDRAIKDLKNAAFYASNQKNEIEPDGIPNAYNRPLSNIKFNIYYHLGLAYYLKGNYDKAISSYKTCMKYSNNNDLKVANINWLYATYSKIGNEDAATVLIEEIPGKMQLIENRFYHDLIMLYRGFVTPDVVIRRNISKGELNANVGYGIGNWYLINGDVNNALNIFTRILDGTQVDSFGFIACEAEMSSLVNSSLGAAAN